MAGRGMNYGRPRGRGHGGGTCVRGPSSDELAQIRHDREVMSRDSMYCKRIFGLRVLNEKAAAGDRAAQVKLLKGKAKYAMAMEPSRKRWQPSGRYGALNRCLKDTSGSSAAIRKRVNGTSMISRSRAAISSA